MSQFYSTYSKSTKNVGKYPPVTGIKLTIKESNILDVTGYATILRLQEKVSSPERYG
jgi:hypothetical protein